MARLDRIERSLRALVAMGILMLGDRAPSARRAEWERIAGEEVAPLTFRWLEDLLAFSIADAEAADEARRTAMTGNG